MEDIFDYCWCCSQVVGGLVDIMVEWFALHFSRALLIACHCAAVRAVGCGCGGGEERERREIFEKSIPYDISTGIDFGGDLSFSLLLHAHVGSRCL